MKRKILLLQFFLTLFILAFIESNLIKVGLLIPMWWVSFGGLRRKEIIAYWIVNVVFVISDIGAIQNNFFKFTQPDFLGLPLWEFFIWGFYLLHASRYILPAPPKEVELKVVVLALVFSQSFAIFENRELILMSTTTVLLLSLYFYHKKEDIFFCLYMMMMGVVIEFVGLTQGLWIYPDRDYQTAMIQFIVMWGGAGIFFYRVMGPWLFATKARISVYQNHHVEVPQAIKIRFEEAKSLYSQNQPEKAGETFLNLKNDIHSSAFQLPYEFFFLQSKVALENGDLRSSIESAREAIKCSTEPKERSYIYLQLCRIYRMMILMGNARAELERAFAELKLCIPGTSGLSFIKTIVFVHTRPSSKEANGWQSDLFQLKVALYEEAGLMAYYHREKMMMIQCSLLAKRYADELGSSVQMINWLGASSCAWELIGWHSKALKLIQKCMKMAEQLPWTYAKNKALLWRALFLDYSFHPDLAAKEFEKISSASSTDLTPYDRRLLITTLSCNYLIRGHMKLSESIVFNYTKTAHSTDNAENFIDWYRIPSLAFLGDFKACEELLKKYNVILLREDKERWQITQYMAGLLIHQYQSKVKNLEEIQNCLNRFKDLNLSPEATFLEASQFWVAKSYLFINLFSQSLISEKEAQNAINQLGRVSRHPNIQAHFLMAKCRLQIYKNNFNFSQWEKEKSQAVALAQRHDNQWVLYENLNCEESYLHRFSNQYSFDEIKNKRASFVSKNSWGDVYCG